MLTLSLGANELTWVNEQVEAIKPPRVGMKSREISVLKDPFIFLKRNKSVNKNSSSKKQKVSPISKKNATSTVKKKSSLSLNMLMNSSAMINGEWYRVGDKVNGYKISKIELRSVLLTKNKKKLLLSTDTKSKNLNFNNK